MLSYKTRKNAPPAGKPKVFFSSHPEDFELYFEALTEDILQISDCTIWYETRRDRLSETEELGLTLNTMQLVVVAITRRFLTEANPARDIFLPYARKQHIPVLPIVVEQGEGLWLELNRISGGIQMLDRTDTDETSISYLKKLEKFLSSVLIDGHLASIIRDAFDAYVFLSYRKKDRKYANELMSRIHENKRFRDIAIWFDEYLVPGENFTKGIEAAMEKSPVFAMVVTPHLLEPQNYVLEYEYKNAKAAKKIIVPVEMMETNHEQLHSSYAGLPDIQKYGETASERQAFHQRFLESLKRVAITESDNSPEHNFYIGLAYLSGIDVEVNRERAAILIEDASEKGCAAATQKLVYMYRNGEGVMRDAWMELILQYRLTGQRRAAYELHPDVDLHLGTTSQYFKTLVDLSDILREQSYLEESMSTAKEALDLCSELVKEVGAREADRNRAMVLNRLGSICREAKCLVDAGIYYRLALEIYEELSEEITTHRALRDLSIGYERLGSIEKAQGQIGASLSSYHKALQLRKRLADENPTARARRDLSVIKTKLASIYKKTGELRRASELYAEAVILDEQLAGEMGTIVSKRDLSISAEKLGRLYYKQEMWEEARTLFEKTVILREEIYKKTGNDKHKEELEYACHNLKKVTR